MDIIKTLAEELQIGRGQVEATVKLIDEGNTIPFIARYRKEMTGSLNDEVLRDLDERLKYLRNLEERKEQVIASIRCLLYTSQMLKAKLYMLKQQENAAKAAGIRGEVKEIGWGSQIRSYVLQPYTMVKDHRTGEESGNVDAVLDGGLDPFISAYLRWMSLGCPGRNASVDN